MTSSTKVFIVEGPREVAYLNNLISVFFRGKYSAKVISLPVEQNIYMLYQQLSKDGFETDVIEVLKDISESARTQLNGICRQDVDEVYLFFDLDAHQNNLPKGIDAFEVLNQMLTAFDNETEQGKLYINYPMVEATRDYIPRYCQAFTSCIIDFNTFENYKTDTGEGNKHANVSQYFITDWNRVLDVFQLRIRCLFANKQVDEHFYRNSVNPISVYAEQRTKYLCQQKAFVLSALPEFLLDYFNSKFWQSHVKARKAHYQECLISK